MIHVLPLESPRRLWKIATRVALKKPSLEYFRRHCDKKKDREKKRKYDIHTVRLHIIPLKKYSNEKPSINYSKSQVDIVSSTLEIL